MDVSDDALRASVWELLSTFHQALSALIPAADRARLPWRDDYQHPDWEAITRSVFDAFVSAPVAVDDSRPNSEYRLAKFDLDYDDYSKLSWISPSRHETNFAVVRFLSRQETFDTVEFAEIEPESLRAVGHTHRAWGQSDYVIVRRGEGGQTIISHAIVADD